MRRTYIDRIDHIARYAPTKPGGLVPWLRRAAHPTLAKAWRACPHGGWMLWLAGYCAEHDSPEHRALVRAAVACVRATTPESAPDAALATLDAADAWVAGTGTLDAVLLATRATDEAWVLLMRQERHAEAVCAEDAARAAWVVRNARAAAQFAHGLDEERFAAIVRRHIRRTPRLPRD